MGRSSLILILLISSFLVGLRPVSSQSQFCGAANGDLYELPACGIDTLGELTDYAYLTSAAPQTVIAQPGQNLTFAISYQIWQPTPPLSAAAFNGCVAGSAFPPGMCPFTILFIPSWIPWPGQSFGVTYGSSQTGTLGRWFVYSAIPASGPPGTKGTASLHMTAPIETGTYLVWMFIAPGLTEASGNIFSSLKPFKLPGHLKVIVLTHASTVTVTAVSNAAVSSPLSVPLLPFGVIGVVVAVVGSVIVVKKGKLKIRSKRAKAPTTEPTISTGYPDLDRTLEGGIPEGYAVLLVSPSYDERDLLLRKIIDSAISSGKPAFYISSDIKRTQDLLARYSHGFYAFSSKADKIPSNVNLYKIPGIENLSEANISLTLALKEARGKEQATKRILVIDILSDLLLRYKAATTRRWLGDFVDKRKVEGFTTLATLNPMVGTKEDNQIVIDYFDGVIEIFEKELRERSRRFVVVKKMYGRKYSESELMLDKDKLF